MSLLQLLLLVIGGALGAIGRFWVALLWSSADHRLPYHTLLVNLVGSAILGALMGGLEPDGAVLSEMPIFLFGGVGFCGALTTFSSFCTETVGLASTSMERALVYVALTLTGVLVAFGLFFALFSGI